jgi:1,6-anhydro-N-acetylmuramate kinase
MLLHHQQAWPAELRRRLLAVMAPANAATAEICELNMCTAREFAGAVNTLLQKTGVDKSNIIAIGSHGQTICHLPPAPDCKFGSTLQIGDNTIIAALTGICTVGNFRPADMVVGGQGAPLVPLVDKLLLTDSKRTRCVQNLGGIGNVTFLPPRGSPQAVIAFDTGPANMLMDALVTLSTKGTMTYDHAGRMAAAGTVHQPMMRKLKRMPYFDKAIPNCKLCRLAGYSFGTHGVEHHRKLSELFAAGATGSHPLRRRGGKSGSGSATGNIFKFFAVPPGAEHPRIGHGKPGQRGTGFCGSRSPDAPRHPRKPPNCDRSRISGGIRQRGPHHGQSSALTNTAWCF